MTICLLIFYRRRLWIFWYFLSDNNNENISNPTSCSDLILISFDLHKLFFLFIVKIPIVLQIFWDIVNFLKVFQKLAICWCFLQREKMIKMDIYTSITLRLRRFLLKIFIYQLFLRQLFCLPHTILFFLRAFIGFYCY